MSKSVKIVMGLSLVLFAAACSQPEPAPVVEPAPIVEEPVFSKV